MANFSRCQWNKCIQKDVCPRFVAVPDINDQVMHFENLCDQANDWKWFYGDRSKMIKVELLENVENKEEINTDRIDT